MTPPEETIESLEALLRPIAEGLRRDQDAVQALLDEGTAAIQKLTRGDYYEVRLGVTRTGLKGMGWVRSA